MKRVAGVLVLGAGMHCLGFAFQPEVEHKTMEGTAISGGALILLGGKPYQPNNTGTGSF